MATRDYIHQWHDDSRKQFNKLLNQSALLADLITEHCQQQALFPSASLLAGVAHRKFQQLSLTIKTTFDGLMENLESSATIHLIIADLEQQQAFISAKTLNWPALQVMPLLQTLTDGALLILHAKRCMQALKAGDLVLFNHQDHWQVRRYLEHSEDRYQLQAVLPGGGDLIFEWGVGDDEFFPVQSFDLQPIGKGCWFEQ